MRHIGFDESTVLNEFAKIAHKEGLIKTAQGEGYVPEGGRGPGPRELQKQLEESSLPAPEVPKAFTPAVQNQFFNQFLKTYPSMAAISAGKRLNAEQLLADVKDIGFRDQYATLSDPKIMTDPQMQGKVKELKRRIGVQLQNLRRMINRLPEERKAYWLKNLETLQTLAAKNEDITKNAADARTTFQSFLSEAAKNNATAWMADKSRIGGWQIRPDVDATELGEALRGEAARADVSVNKDARQVATALVNKYFPQQTAPAAKASADDGFIVVNAKEESGKYYDVTGETGEQLVDKAHPGGGTRTELTHSKTDENLVETIVEQQEKDIEVARSVPKGTYAELMSLYSILIKMGYKDHLGELKTIINSVATADDIIDHTLTALADKLDRLGFRKSADAVDEMLKKKVAQSEAADQFKQDILSVLQNVDADRFTQPMKERAINEWSKRSMPTLVEAVSAARDLSERWGKMFPQLPPVAQNLSRRYSPQLQYEQKLRELQRGAPGGVAGNVRPGEETTEELPLVPIPAQSKGKGYQRAPWVGKFQERFNAAIEGTPYERAGNTLKVDSILGPKTRSAVNLVKAYHGMSKFEEEMAKRRTVKQYKGKETAPVGPAAPEAPTLPKQEALKVYNSIIDRLENEKYPRLKGQIAGTGDRWRALRQKVWNLASTGKFTEDQIVNYFNIDRMKSLMRGGKLAPPAMPKVTPGR